MNGLLKILLHSWKFIQWHWFAGFSLKASHTDLHPAVVPKSRGTSASPDCTFWGACVALWDEASWSSKLQRSVAALEHPDTGESQAISVSLNNECKLFFEVIQYIACGPWDGRLENQKIS